MITNRISIAVLLYTLFSLTFLSCSQNKYDQVADVNTSELPLLELDHQFTITDSDDIFLQQINEVKSDSKGRIYLSDQRALQIHLYDSNGQYLTSIGRDGAGPGEFQSLISVFIDQNDQLFAIDMNQTRNTVFVENSNTWEPEYIFSIEGQRYGIESADSDGNLVLRQGLPRGPEPGAFWYEHELATGNLSDGLIEQNILTIKDMGYLYSDEGIMQRIPFGRTTIVSRDLYGNIYLVWNDQFELAKYSAKMEFIDSLSVSIPNQPITNEESRSIVDRLGNNFRSLARTHMPGSKPVINNMFVDRNENIWLQTFDSPEYLVLDSVGNPLKSFDLNSDLRLVHVDENRLYTLKSGDEGYQIDVYDYQL